MPVLDPRLGSHVHETAAIVPEEMIGQMRELLGRTVAVLLLFFVPADLGVLGVPLQVVTYVEVEVAIAVQIREGGRGGPVPVASQARRVSHLAKRPITFVVIKGVGAPSCDEQVGMPVVVVIGDGDPMAIAAREPIDAGGGGGILKRAVPAVAKEPVAIVAGTRIRREDAPLDDVDVEPAVAVEVDQA